MRSASPRIISDPKNVGPIAHSLCLELMAGSKADSITPRSTSHLLKSGIRRRFQQRLG